MKAYYNEIDRHAAAWLRELIREGLIAPGDVDERSILEVQASDLEGYGQCHFFAGIGGWSRALRLAQIPDSRPIWTGSCPCQPLSSAGLRKGHADERHVWPAFYRLIAQRRPAKVFGEQVASADGREWLAGVRADLEGVGYACGGADLCSAGVGAPNIRQRLYWMADSSGQGITGGHRQTDGAREKARVRSGNEPVDRGATDGLADSERGRREQPDQGERKLQITDPHRADGRLADTDGRESGDGQVQPGGKHGQQPEDGRAGGVGDAVRQRRRGRNQPGPRAEGKQVGQPEDRADPANKSGDGRKDAGTGRVEHAEFPRLAGHAGLEAHGPAATPGAGEPRRLGDSTGGGLEGRGREESDLPAQPGFWSVCDLLPCTDGKARRVEPGSFPLAHGVPARMVRLRGYGNAINPEAAALFIRACETLT